MRKTQTRREFLLAVSATVTPPMATVTIAQERSTARKPALEYQTAEALLAALTAREISAVELTRHAIARIESLDSRINAVVVRDFERAAAAAAEADRGLAAGERRPLLGLPMTVKEAFNVAGLPTTWGFPRDRDWRPTEDALIVARAKAAGAIVLGKTNVPSGLRTGRAITTSMAQPTILGTPVARRVVPLAARRPRWPPATCPWILAPTSAVRCARRPTFAGCSRTNRARAWFQPVDTPRRACRYRFWGGGTHGAQRLRS